MRAKIIAALIGCTFLVRAAELVTKENTRLQVLSVLFPKLTIAEMNGEKIDRSSSIEGINFPDALKNEKVYAIEGAPINEIEACAASSAADPIDRVGGHRELRFKLFEIRTANSERRQIAVIQYEFSDANPPASCPSIAKAVLLSNVRSTWKIEDEFLRDTVHHSIGWQTISFADLDCDGIEELLAASDGGGAGYYASDLSIFSLASNKLSEIVSVPQLVIADTEEEQRRSAAVFDIKKTVLEHGKRFCFIQTTYVFKGKRLQPPKVTHPCYAPGNEPKKY